MNTIQGDWRCLLPVPAPTTAPLRVQLLGSTRLSRVAIPFLLERSGARIVGLDPGAEDESLPWYAPVRGLCRDNGIPLRRCAPAEADLVLDLDPDARPAKGEGFLIRLLPPTGSRSADVNRWLMGPTEGVWDAFFGTPDGLYEFSLKSLRLQSEEDGERLMQHATSCCMEVLAEGLEKMLAGETPELLPRPLVSGRWRAQESFVIWDQPALRVIARIRAASGPWGGARPSLGETTLWLEDATLEADQTPPEWLPGTIVSVDAGGIVVATGRGLVRLRRFRPGWRPERDAAEFVTEVGASPGYQLS